MRYSFGEFLFDSETGVLWRNGEIVPLQPQPARLLRLFLQRPGEVVTREEIRQVLWPDRIVDYEKGIAFCLAQLRSALRSEDDAKGFIQTIPKRGYRFTNASKSVAPAPIRRRVKRRLVATVVGLALVGLAAWYGLASVSPGTSTAPNVTIDLEFARDLLRQGDLGAGITLITGVLDSAPADPEALTLLASAWLRSPTLDPSERRRRAQQAVGRALEINPNHARALLLRARMAWLDEWRWAAAAADLHQAAVLHPDDAEVNLAYGIYLVSSGRTAAGVSRVEHALTRDVLGTVVGADACWAFYAARRFDRAILLASRVRMLRPTDRSALQCELNARIEAGDRAGALAVYTGTRLNGEPAASYREFLEAMARKDGTGTLAGIGWRIRLGSHDEAMRALESLVRSREPSAVSLASDPRLDPLRDDPRFRRLLRDVGFPALET
jgi:DNA-binding winged helix-turn-helix (wHTH) protein/Tfp pilus assembly protein PilF